MYYGYELHYCIMQTCPCNVDTLTPYFYTVKLGFTGVFNTSRRAVTYVGRTCGTTLLFVHLYAKAIKYV